MWWHIQYADWLGFVLAYLSSYPARLFAAAFEPLRMALGLVWDDVRRKDAHARRKAGKGHHLLAG